MDINSSEAVKRFSEAITIPTESSDDSPAELAKFQSFHTFLEDNFPLFHNKTSKETINEFALMYLWKSSKSSEKKLPFALLAHMDVVGIESGTEKDWKHPPYSGIVDDEYIWGRGTLDDKCALVGILEAAESLIKDGYEPERDIYFCFSHNEEGISGGPDSGALGMAARLKERGIRFEFVLDEGGAVITDSFMGLNKPIATIGLAEKGYTDLRVTVNDTGGHSSKPPDETAITKLSSLIIKYKKINDKNVVFTDTLIMTLKTVGKNTKGFFGFVMRHPKAFLPLVKSQLLKNEQTAAMIRTTVAPTVLRSGREPNMLPQNATVTFNIRTIPGEDSETIESRIREAAGTDKKYSLDYITNSPSLPETPSDTDTVKLLSKLTDEIHGAIPLPYLVIAMTDSREYKDITDEIYRFYPFAMTFEELDTIHNTNERIKIGSYLDGIEFYKRFIEESGKR